MAQNKHFRADRDKMHCGVADTTFVSAVAGVDRNFFVRCKAHGPRDVVWSGGAVNRYGAFFACNNVISVWSSSQGGVVDGHLLNQRKPTNACSGTKSSCFLAALSA